jgi:hypothetical protein
MKSNNLDINTITNDIIMFRILIALLVPVAIFSYYVAFHLDKVLIYLNLV